MAKDDAIRNQKVFITLESVLNLQLDYAQSVVTYGAKETETDEMKEFYRGRVSVFEEVIKTLQLPITLRRNTN